MIGAVSQNFPHWAARALLVGWGMVDVGVARALTDLAIGESRRASEIAHHIPDIIPDRSECKARLLSLLSEGHRLDFIVSGLAAVRADEPDTDTVTAILDAVERHGDHPLFPARSTLIRAWADDYRVADLAYRALVEPGGDIVAAASAAAKIEALQPHVLEVIGVLPTHLRLFLARQLEVFAGDEAVASTIARYRHEHHPAVRTQCAILHHRATICTDEMIAVLRNDLVKPEMPMDATREAAFCGLLEMGRLEVFASAMEATRPDQPLSLHAISSVRYNGPLWQQIATHWTTLKNAFGDSLPYRLTGGKSVGVWEALAAFAHQSRELARDVLEYIQSSGPDALWGEAALRFLALEKGASPMVSDACLAHLRASVQAGRSVSLEAGIAAAEIVGRLFGRADPILSVVSEELIGDPGRPGTLPLIALCAGWPSSVQLDQIFRHVRDKKVELPWIAHGSIVATKSRPERVLEALGKFAEYSGWGRPPEIRFVSSLFVRRLREDDEVYSGALDLESKANRADGACLLRLLAESRTLTPLVRARLEERAMREVSGTAAPVLVRDPFGGRLVHAADLLLDGFFSR